MYQSKDSLSLMKSKKWFLTLNTAVFMLYTVLEFGRMQDDKPSNIFKKISHYLLQRNAEERL